MRYLVIDAALHGTGIRNYYEGGYVKPEQLGISFKLIEKINSWLAIYENEHFNGFSDNEVIENLDKEGKEIARQIKSELVDAKIEYYSAARLVKESI